MVNNQIALQVKPWTFDLKDPLGTAMMDAEKIKGTQARNEGIGIRNELDTLQLQDQTAESDALRQFREAQGAGDPNAMDALAGFPEHQARIQKALQGMRQSERDKALEKSLMLTTAAEDVMRYPAGSPMRDQALQVQLMALAANGVIGEDMVEYYTENPPNDIDLMRIVSPKEAINATIADREKAKATREAIIEAGNDREELITDLVRKEREGQRKLRFGDMGAYADEDDLRAFNEEMRGFEDSLRQRFGQPKDWRRMVPDLDDLVSLEPYQPEQPAPAPAQPAPMEMGRGDLQPNAITGALPSVAAQPPAQPQGNLLASPSPGTGPVPVQPQPGPAQIAPPVRKMFRNPQTGEEQLFEVRNGQWVPVAQ